MDSVARRHRCLMLGSLCSRSLAPSLLGQGVTVAGGETATAIAATTAARVGPHAYPPPAAGKPRVGASVPNHLSYDDQQLLLSLSHTAECRVCQWREPRKRQLSSQGRILRLRVFSTYSADSSSFPGSTVVAMPCNGLQWALCVEGALLSERKSGESPSPTTSPTAQKQQASPLAASPSSSPERLPPPSQTSPSPLHHSPAPAAAPQAARELSPPLGSFLRRVVMSLDPNVYPTDNVIEWNRSNGLPPDLPRLELRRPCGASGTECNVTVTIEIEHRLVPGDELLKVSDRLMAFLDGGTGALPAEQSLSQLMQQLWRYIRENRLLVHVPLAVAQQLPPQQHGATAVSEQLPTPVVRCDASLQHVFRRDSFALGELPALLAEHLHRPDPISFMYRVKVPPSSFIVAGSPAAVSPAAGVGQPWSETYMPASHDFASADVKTIDVPVFVSNDGPCIKECCLSARSRIDDGQPEVPGAEVARLDGQMSESETYMPASHDFASADVKTIDVPVFVSNDGPCIKECCLSARSRIDDGQPEVPGAEVARLDGQMSELVDQIEERLHRRAFLLGLSEQPTQFLLRLVACCARDGRLLRADPGQDPDAERRAEFYTQPVAPAAAAAFLRSLRSQKVALLLEQRQQLLQHVRAAQQHAGPQHLQ
eukprot:TRINITY_DN262_c1_g1_i1.p1 TRINITY_DN262_c1_g1~~TRINITY_DN262_c1_g1_i1.p1  ORF type:complete len:729 (-),score=179.07 TRINITY_DN262_c1_g1_i1:890-2851(-)